MILKMQKLSSLIGDTIPIPTRASQGAAGIDLAACTTEPITILPGERKVIPTGIAIELPEKGYVALLYIRSSLGFKKGITLANSVGVIDSDFRGEIKASLYNSSKVSYTVIPGDRIAQLVVTPIENPTIQFVADLGETQRGTGGFGSTGK